MKWEYVYSVWEPKEIKYKFKVIGKEVAKDYVFAEEVRKIESWISNIYNWEGLEV